MKIFSDDKAFNDFYDEVITITGKRKSIPGNCFYSVVKSCLFDLGFGDVLNSISENTTQKCISVQIKKNSSVDSQQVDIRDYWIFDFPPQIGDKITLQNGKSFSVYEVSTLDKLDYTLKAREC